MKSLPLLLTLAFAITSLVAFAADPPGFGNTGSPDPIPVDGGLSLLAAGGAALALRKLRKQKEKKAPDIYQLPNRQLL
jgi:hypothetical protein